MPAASPTWWKNGVVYQIWPASYKDSNGDGYGDIPGILTTLDYLRELGVDIIWLSPMYDSPQYDMGYDIRNYEDIWSSFGTMADMDKLIDGCHSRGMKLLLDLVVNHTSFEHKWFLESRKSKDNPYSDWYMWKDPKYVNGVRHPPNNWRAIFGGSAWEYAPERDQYWLHLFVPEQPDLNWENPTTRKAIYESAIEFWLKKGIDGFRVDTVNLYSKDITFPDAPVRDPESEYQISEEFWTNGPRMHEWLKEMRSTVLDKYGPDVMMVGELPGTKADEVMRYVSSTARELNMVFDFDMVNLGRPSHDKHLSGPHTLQQFVETVKKIQDLLKDKNADPWVTVFGENHDQARSISRFATDSPQYRVKAAKLMAIVLASLSGTLFLYQGQEIGMTNFPKDWDESEIRDVDALNYWNDMNKRYPGDRKMLQAALDGIQRVSRDNARTPVQWSNCENAGFTTGKPWISVNPNYKEGINVEDEQKDPESVLAFWQKALKMRKEYSTLFTHGDFDVVEDGADGKTIFAFVKNSAKRSALVVANFSDKEVTFKAGTPGDAPSITTEMDLILSNVDTKDISDEHPVMTPWEARVYLMTGQLIKNEDDH